ncbi:hypothetical protein [Desulfurivibrio sp. C05AmB]|uniref:hypothetical protein n=1 Tax=Desulfurivibrio sp. C05AmB TaxID=3374371 RepID=UPI00376ECD96
MESRSTAENKIIKVGSLAALRGLVDGQEYTVGPVGALAIAREMDDEIFSTLADEIQKLRAEIAALKDQAGNLRGFEYRGVYAPGGKYGPGDFVTFDGGLWACRKATSASPPGPDWQLAVKKGRDGRGGGR